MNVLIVYGTYSGGTQIAAEIIAGVFAQQGLDVTIQDVHKTKPEDFAPYSHIIFGSNSWFEEKEEGNMNSGYHKLKALMGPDTLKDKICFVYGLGDANMYTSTFTKSVEHLAGFITDFGGTQKLDPLRINRFYFERQENEQIIADWAHTVAQSITSQGSE